MFKKKRRIGTVVWLSLMIAVFITAMLKGPLGLVLGMMAAEVCVIFRSYIMRNGKIIFKFHPIPQQGIQIR